MDLAADFPAAWIGWAVVAGGAGLLVVSGLDHVAHRDRLTATLHGHALPPAVMSGIRRLLGPVEALVGATALVAMCTGTRAISAAAVVAALYTGFAVYLLRLRRRAPHASCGCLGGGEPVGLVTVLRAAVFAVGAAAAVVLKGCPGWPAALFVIAAGAVIAGIVVTAAGVLILTGGSAPKTH